MPNFLISKGNSGKLIYYNVYEKFFSNKNKGILKFLYYKKKIFLIIRTNRLSVI